MEILEVRRLKGIDVNDEINVVIFKSPVNKLVIKVNGDVVAILENGLFPISRNKIIEGIRQNAIEGIVNVIQISKIITEAIK